MSNYSPICWRCGRPNDSGVGTNCIDCREEGGDALALAMGIFLIVIFTFTGLVWLASVILK